MDIEKLLLETETRTYTLEEILTIFHETNIKPNSYKNVKVIIELTPNKWLYGVMGYSKKTDIMQVIVKGFFTETGSQYLTELLNYPLKILKLKEPIPHMKLYELWK